MRYSDISLDLSPEAVCWVGSPPFEFVERRRIAKGDQNNASALAMSIHSGTHIDAPFYFIDGRLTIEEILLERFVGPALIHAVETKSTSPKSM